MLPVIRTKRATADIYEIALYLFDRGAVNAAVRFPKAVDESVEFIASFPDLGEIVSPPERPNMVIRAIAVQSFPNYVIYFRRTPDRISIVRVLHGSRQAEFPSESES